MEIIEKTKEFGKKHKKAIVGTGVAVGGITLAGVGYFFGVKTGIKINNKSWSNAIDNALRNGESFVLANGISGEKALVKVSELIEEVSET